jgi:hypothetical protein
LFVAVGLTACAGQGTIPGTEFPTRGESAGIKSAVRVAACDEGARCAISRIRLAKSDPSYAVATFYASNVGGVLAVLHHGKRRWKVISIGSAFVGCDAVDAAIRDDLALDCPDNRHDTGQQAAPPASSPPKGPAAPADPDSGRATDKHFVVDDLQIEDDGLGDIGGFARIRNVSSEALSLTFTFTFFQSGRIVGIAQGSGSEVAPGQTITAQLVSQAEMFYGQFDYQFQVDVEF